MGQGAAATEEIIRLLNGGDFAVALDRLRSWHTSLAGGGDDGVQPFSGATTTGSQPSRGTVGGGEGAAAMAPVRRVLKQRLLETAATNHTAVHTLVHALTLVCGCEEAYSYYLHVRKVHIDAALSATVRGGNLNDLSVRARGIIALEHALLTIVRADGLALLSPASRAFAPLNGTRARLYGLGLKRYAARAVQLLEALEHAGAGAPEQPGQADAADELVGAPMGAEGEPAPADRGSGVSRAPAAAAATTQAAAADAHGALDDRPTAVDAVPVWRVAVPLLQRAARFESLLLQVVSASPEAEPAAQQRQERQHGARSSEASAGAVIELSMRSRDRLEDALWAHLAALESERATDDTADDDNAVALAERRQGSSSGSGSRLRRGLHRGAAAVVQPEQAGHTPVHVSMVHVQSGGLAGLLAAASRLFGGRRLRAAPPVPAPTSAAAAAARAGPGASAAAGAGSNVGGSWMTAEEEVDEEARAGPVANGTGRLLLAAETPLFSHSSMAAQAVQPLALPPNRAPTISAPGRQLPRAPALRSAPCAAADGRKVLRSCARCVRAVDWLCAAVALVRPLQPLGAMVCQAVGAHLSSYCKYAQAAALLHAHRWGADGLLVLASLRAAAECALRSAAVIEKASAADGRQAGGGGGRLLLAASELNGAAQRLQHGLLDSAVSTLCAVCCADVEMHAAWKSSRPHAKAKVAAESALAVASDGLRLWRLSIAAHCHDAMRSLPAPTAADMCLRLAAASAAELAAAYALPNRIVPSRVRCAQLCTDLAFLAASCAHIEQALAPQAARLRAEDEAGLGEFGLRTSATRRGSSQRMASSSSAVSTLAADVGRQHSQPLPGQPIFATARNSPSAGASPASRGSAWSAELTAHGCSSRQPPSSWRSAPMPRRSAHTAQPQQHAGAKPCPPELSLRSLARLCDGIVAALCPLDGAAASLALLDRVTELTAERSCSKGGGQRGEETPDAEDPAVVAATRTARPRAITAPVVAPATPATLGVAAGWLQPTVASESGGHGSSHAGLVFDAVAQLDADGATHLPLPPTRTSFVPAPAAAAHGALGARAAELWGEWPLALLCVMRSKHRLLLASADDFPPLDDGLAEPQARTLLAQACDRLEQACKLPGALPVLLPADGGGLLGGTDAAEVILRQLSTAALPAPAAR